MFPVQLTTSSIGNLTRLIHTFAICDDDHTYIHTYIRKTLQLFFGMLRTILEIIFLRASSVGRGGICCQTFSFCPKKLLHKGGVCCQTSHTSGIGHLVE